MIIPNKEAMGGRQRVVEGRNERKKERKREREREKENQIKIKTGKKDKRDK